MGPDRERPSRSDEQVPSPEMATDEMPAELSQSVDAQRETVEYREQMATGRRIMAENRAVLAALAK